MEIQTFNTNQARMYAKVSFMSGFEDIPSFEEAFDSDSLRKFYQQQTDFSSCCDSPSTDDSAFEVETQASPLLKYLNKFDQETPALQSAINLNQIFDSAEMAGESFPESSLQRDSYEPLYNKAMEASTKLNLSMPKLPVEIKKVFEMKGMLSMNVCGGNLTFNGVAQPQDNLLKPTATQADTKFEVLLQSKKIFKIQRDAKPKTPTKQKIAKSKTVSSESAKTTQKESKKGKALTQIL